MATKKTKQTGKSSKTQAKAGKQGKKPVQKKAASRAKAVKKVPSIPTSPLIEVRNSPIHGRGVYAKTRIVKGGRVIEYLGDRVSHAEADRRYEIKDNDDGHTFLFIVDNRTVIDAGVGGNEARFINHGCSPNCETVTEDRRIFIEATRTMKPGEELCYDYQLVWESTDDPEDLKLYDCRCGAKNCRGTMLDPVPLDKAKQAAKAKKKSKSKAKTKAKTKAGAKSKSKAKRKKK
jgi:SET domain-containing protein